MTVTANARSEGSYAKISLVGLTHIPVGVSDGDDIDPNI
jgi:hypothetical protein